MKNHPLQSTIVLRDRIITHNHSALQCSDLQYTSMYTHFLSSSLSIEFMIFLDAFGFGG